MFCGKAGDVVEQKNEEVVKPARRYVYQPLGKESEEYMNAKEMFGLVVWTKDNLAEQRAKMDKMYADYFKFDAKTFADQSEFTVKNGDRDIKVYVHTPKELEEELKPVVLHCHGGGQVVGSAKSEIAIQSAKAQAAGVVIFNVEYGLAPENVNRGCEDLYAVLKYTIENAAQLGVDKNRIALSGESGGAHTVFACCNILASKTEGHLVKLVNVTIPMMGYYYFVTDIDKMANREQKESATLEVAIYKFLATDIDTQVKEKDPMLFPELASIETMKKWPPVAIFTAEQGMYISSVEFIADKLEKAGKLLECAIYPGVGHLVGMSEGPIGKKYNAEQLEAYTYYLK